MQDEKERGTELDYCDLDPTKICDNCCKCIDSGKDYEDFQIELTDSISTLDEIMELPLTTICLTTMMNIPLTPTTLLHWI